MIIPEDRAHYAITIDDPASHGVERKNTLGQFIARDQTFRVAVGMGDVFVPRAAVTIVQRLPN